jgi:hypothetical protein
MSTEIFRKYIDLLNESVSDTELSQITQALGELERVLAKEKYHPKGLRSYFNEDEPPDPPLFAPGGESSPSGPKPRIPRLPGETGEEYLARVRELARSAQRLGIRSGTPTSTPTEPVDINPFSRDPMGRTVEPITARASTGGTVTATPTGIVHTAPPAPPAPKPSGLRIPKKYAYPALAAGALYGAYELVHQLLKIRFSDLDPTDQDAIEKNLSIIEPYIKPEVLPTLPEQIQLRISTVLKMLEKLGKTSSSPVAAAEKPAEKPAFNPANPWQQPSSSWTPTGTPSAEDIATFKKALQAARQNVSGVRESLYMSRLSEAEKMAMLRDKINEDVIPAWLSSLTTSDSFWVGLAEYLSIGAATSGTIGGLKDLWAKFLSETPDMAAEGVGLWTKVKSFKNWLKLSYPKMVKTGKLSIWAGVTAAGLAVAKAAWDIWGLTKVASGAEQTIQDLPKAGNNATQAYNMFLHMPQAYWDSLNANEKEDIDEFVLSYCLAHPDAPNCSDQKNSICSIHPDWPGCDSWLKLPGKKPK